MKKLLKVALVASSLIVVLPVQADFISSNSYAHKALVEICTDAMNDNVRGLRSTLNEYNISRKNAAQKVMCNQQWLVSFARTHQAHRVVSMLEKYEPAPERKVTITDISPAN